MIASDAGLAEPHVVGQAAAYPPLGEAGQPIEALLLVVAQFRLQGGGHLRVKVAAGADLLQLLFPAVVGADRGLADQVFERQGGQRMDQQLVIVESVGIDAEVLQSFPELLGEGDELAGTDLDEPSSGGLDG